MCLGQHIYTFAKNYPNEKMHKATSLNLINLGK